MLPPVIDIEFYGDKGRHPPKPMQAQINELVHTPEIHYGMKPILYAAKKPYAVYLSG